MRSVRRMCLSSAALGLLIFAAPALASDSEVRAFDIPAEDAASALKLYARQSGQAIVDPPVWAKRVRANAIKGNFTPQEALTRLLEGTELAVRPKTTMVLKLAGRAPDQPMVTSIGAPAQADIPATTKPSSGRAEHINTSDVAFGRYPPASAVQISGEEFTRWGAVNAEELLNSLPQLVADKTAFSNSDGDGLATANLRGLGAKRTLVLVNGRRYIPGDLSGAVDLNVIPTFLLDRAQIGIGGVAYGADALAGVVDLRLRRVTGLEVGGQYAVTQEGDGARINAHFALGTDFAAGRGHVTVYGDYLNRQAITQDRRAFSGVPLADQGGVLAPALSSTTPGGRFVAAPVSSTTGAGRFVVAPSVTVPAGGRLGSTVVNRGSGTTFGSSQGATFGTPGTTSRNYVAVDGYNAASDTYLQLPQRRWAFGLFGEYEINSGITAYGEFAFTANKVVMQFAPTEITGRYRVNTAANAKYWSAADIAAIAAIDANEELIRAAYMARGVPSDTTFTTNFYLPGAGVTILDVYRRFTEGGPRVSVNDRRAFRSLVGLKGDLSPRWSYDTYFSYASTRNTNIQSGGVSLARFTLAVEQGTVNVYGANTLTPDMVNAIAVTAQNREDADLAVAHASIHGDVLNLGFGAKDIGLTLGVEYRRMSGGNLPDALALRGDVMGFAPSVAAAGRYDTREVFGDITVPIVEGRPFAHLVQVDGGIRYADYSLNSLSPNVIYNVRGLWALDDQIALHGHFERGARAPNIAELYGLNGNTDLKSEKSRTWVLGAQVHPAIAPGFNVSLDHFDMAVTDMILTSDRLSIPNSNLASQKTAGWDLQVGFTQPVGFDLLSGEGRISFSTLGTYTTKNVLRTGGAVSPKFLVGAYGALGASLQAKWKWTSSLAWDDGPLTAALRWRHLSGVRDNDAGAVYAVERIGAHNLFDLSLSYAVTGQVRLSAGINNLLDRRPPIVGANQEQANGFPGTYDMRGRDFFLSAKGSF